jgi:hypothetical protein
MLRVMTLSKNGAKPSQSERQTTIKSIEIIVEVPNFNVRRQLIANS